MDMKPSYSKKAGRKIDALAENMTEKIDPVKVYEDSKLKPSQDELRYDDPECECLFMSDEVVRRIKVIDKWYEPWTENDVWDRIKNESPDTAEKIIATKDNIDTVFNLRKKDSSSTSWQNVLDAIDAYAEAWRTIPGRFRL